jgi:hypothetical protein
MTVVVTAALALTAGVSSVLAERRRAKRTVRAIDLMRAGGQRL